MKNLKPDNKLNIYTIKIQKVITKKKKTEIKLMIVCKLN